ncbi:MAG: site-specific integrase [Candidatus Obscuribacterales bacterium]|nr:site-specific integrase [Candidatus Obscuribacterales bacterium]
MKASREMLFQIELPDTDNSLLGAYESWLERQAIRSSSRRIYMHNVGRLLKASRRRIFYDEQRFLEFMESFLLKHADRGLFTAARSLARFLGFAEPEVLLKAPARKRKIVFLSDQEEKNYLEAVHKIPNLRNRLIVLLIFQAGCRINEILNLEESDLEEWQGNMILQIKGRNQRRLSLEPELSELLSSYLATKEKTACKLLFSTRNNCPMDQQSVDAIVRGTGSRVGLNVSAGILRNSYKLRLFKRGFAADELARLCGQKRLRKEDKQVLYQGLS